MSHSAAARWQFSHASERHNVSWSVALSPVWSCSVRYILLHQNHDFAFQTKTGFPSFDKNQQRKLANLSTLCVHSEGTRFFWKPAGTYCPVLQKTELAIATALQCMIVDTPGKWQRMQSNPAWVPSGEQKKQLVFPWNLRDNGNIPVWILSKSSCDCLALWRHFIQNKNYGFQISFVHFVDLQNCCTFVNASIIRIWISLHKLWTNIAILNSVLTFLFQYRIILCNLSLPFHKSLAIERRPDPRGHLNLQFWPSFTDRKVLG